mgnify:CR=1 FL=1
MPSIGNNIIILNRIDSSNNYAMQQVHAGLAEHGQVWFALEQTAGKGQRGKEWKAAPSENITMSIALKTNKLPIDQQFRLSVAVSLAILDFFTMYVSTNVSIKWPNDLYWCDRKAGGVLIENIVSGGSNDGVSPFIANWKWAVIGIGININQTDFSDDLPNPVSLQQITGEKYDVIVLAKQLCSKLEMYWQQLHSGQWATIFERYNQHLFKKGKAVRLRKKNVVMPCTIRGVSEDGKLLIEEDENMRFDWGDVKWEL